MDALPTLTVADLVAVPELGITRAWIPDPSVPVRWVATSELDDPTPFLEGGEVLLTTGLATAAHGAAQWRAYVGRLATLGVSALGLGVGLTHDAAPQPLREAAAGAGLGLFEVPPPTRFVAISRAVAALLEPAEQAAARLQRELTQDATRPDARSRVTARVAQVLRGACAVVDPDGAVTDGALDLDPDVLASALVRIRADDRRSSTSISGPDSSTAVHPVGLGGTPRAYLVATTPGRWSPFQRSAVLTAAAVLSLVESGRAEQRDAERRVVAAGVRLALDGDAAGASRVLDLARPPRTVPDPLCALHLGGTPGAVTEAVDHIETGALVGTHEDTTVVLVDEAGIDRVVEAAQHAGAWVGVGPTVPAAEAARSAAGASAALAQASDARPVTRWAEQTRAGIGALVPPGAAAAFASEVLGRLRAEPDGTALEDTLRAYLEEQGHPGRISDRLGIHRNTVRGRIRRIDALTGRPVADAGARADLWFALQTTAPPALG
ncbi:UNVERIFIED_CONTAM: hypothetical protein LK11_09550 [Mumia flava]|uniref:PucR family transcriptional regulator n=1 Tax=Mumia flava TaxID=1348852 RepID=UPI000575232E|nr:PucR family transcriptional regulator [Mumia flava]